MTTLFEETTINGLTMHNRMVRSATWEGMCDVDGRPTEKLINFYHNLTQGGIGLIVSGYTFVRPEGKGLPGGAQHWRQSGPSPISETRSVQRRK